MSIFNVQPARYLKHVTVYELKRRAWQTNLNNRIMINELTFPYSLHKLYVNRRLTIIALISHTNFPRREGSVVERSPRELWVVGSIPDRIIPKTLWKIVPDASLLSAQHIKTALASLSSQTSLKRDGFHPEWADEND